MVQSGGSGRMTCTKQIESMYPSMCIDCKKDQVLLSDLEEIRVISDEMGARLLDRLFEKCFRKPPMTRDASIAKLIGCIWTHPRYSAKGAEKSLSRGSPH